MSLALLLAVLHASSGASLEGSVRSSDASAPVVSAVVEVSGASANGSPLRALTDSAGNYALPELPAGMYHLKVSRIGYDPRELDVFVVTGPRVVVDIVLEPRPERLSEVRINADSGRDVFGRRFASPPMSDDLESTIVSGDALHQDPALASADALESLAARGLAGARDEAPTSLHVRGGGASENGM
ncbi:MAG: carboxypeptidase regulatory-like domain-containing protein, partial [Gemmatimonadaceae bacterium]|nr:carboxypeptidase regulatory-like domain-containing protein [Gemmatimonadaceae bacterium]